MAEDLETEDQVDDQGTWVPDEVDEEVEQEAPEQETEQQDAAPPEETEVVAQAETPEEENPPSDWSPTLPPSLYTDEEQSWLERTQDDPDPKIRLQASQFMINRSQEFHAKAMLVAQAQMSSIPQPFMALHGPVVAEYLNTIVSADRRGTPEAAEEAQAWAILKRARQIGSAKAYREAANLLEGQRVVTVTPTKTVVPKVPIPAEQRVPVGGTGLNPSQASRKPNRGTDRIGTALGIEMD